MLAGELLIAEYAINSFSELVIEHEPLVQQVNQEIMSEVNQVESLMPTTQMRQFDIYIGTDRKNFLQTGDAFGAMVVGISNHEAANIQGLLAKTGLSATDFYRVVQLDMSSKIVGIHPDRPVWLQLASSYFNSLLSSTVDRRPLLLFVFGQESVRPHLIYAWDSELMQLIGHVEIDSSFDLFSPDRHSPFTNPSMAAGYRFFGAEAVGELMMVSVGDQPFSSAVIVNRRLDDGEICGLVGLMIPGSCEESTFLGNDGNLVPQICSDPLFICGYSGSGCTKFSSVFYNFCQTLGSDLQLYTRQMSNLFDNLPEEAMLEFMRFDGGAFTLNICGSELNFSYIFEPNAFKTFLVSCPQSGQLQANIYPQISLDQGEKNAYQIFGKLVARCLVGTQIYSSRLGVEIGVHEQFVSRYLDHLQRMQMARIPIAATLYTFGFRLAGISSSLQFTNDEGEDISSQMMLAQFEEYSGIGTQELVVIPDKYNFQSRFIRPRVCDKVVSISTFGNSSSRAVSISTHSPRLAYSSCLSSQFQIRHHGKVGINLTLDPTGKFAIKQATSMYATPDGNLIGWKLGTRSSADRRHTSQPCLIRLEIPKDSPVLTGDCQKFRCQTALVTNIYILEPYRDNVWVKLDGTTTHTFGSDLAGVFDPTQLPEVDCCESLVSKNFVYKAGKHIHVSNFCYKITSCAAGIHFCIGLESLFGYFQGQEEIKLLPVTADTRPTSFIKYDSFAEVIPSTFDSETFEKSIEYLMEPDEGAAGKYDSETFEKSTEHLTEGHGAAAVGQGLIEPPATSDDQLILEGHLDSELEPLCGEEVDAEERSFVQRILSWFSAASKHRKRE